jgi:F-type H+-transporting ATPase subunit delta
MSNLVAKRYVKALMSREDVAKVYNELAQIATAYSDAKFLSIIESTDIKSSAKLGLILSFIDDCSSTTTNLINLLDENKRLNIVPDIANELEKELAQINNTFNGIVYTDQELSNEVMIEIQDSFSKKFNTTLTLTQNICDYNGIKVDIEGLGVEIAFSKERLKSQMINHILKAV